MLFNYSQRGAFDWYLKTNYRFKIITVSLVACTNNIYTYICVYFLVGEGRSLTAIRIDPDVMSFLYIVQCTIGRYLRKLIGLRWCKISSCGSFLFRSVEDHYLFHTKLTILRDYKQGINYRQKFTYLLFYARSTILTFCINALRINVDVSTI